MCLYSELKSITMDALTKVNKELMTKPVRVMVKRLGPNYSRNAKQEFSVSERERRKKLIKQIATNHTTLAGHGTSLRNCIPAKVPSR